MNEKELRARHQFLIHERDDLEKKLRDVKEELRGVTSSLTRYNAAQKKLDARLKNGVDERKLQKAREALGRAVRASEMRAAGMTFREIGDAMGVCAQRALQLAKSRETLERAIAQASKPG